MISAWFTSRTPVDEIPTKIANSIIAEKDGASEANTKTRDNSSPNPINSGQARGPDTIPASGTLAISETTPTTRYSRKMSLAGTPKFRSMYPGSSTCAENRQTVITIQKAHSMRNRGLPIRYLNPDPSSRAIDRRPETAVAGTFVNQVVNGNATRKNPAIWK